MATPTPAPDLKIPHSEHTVDVSIIDTTVKITGLPTAAFTQPQIPGYEVIVGGIAYSFWIKHKNADTHGKYENLIFDLGVRKDIENSPKAIIEQAQGGGLEMDVKKHVYEILQDEGRDPADIGGIIWSHYHVDHTGKPDLFPKSTDLIVGPGFKKAFIPGFPTNQESMVDERAWEGRELREINFDGENALMIGKFKAFDFYGDGSFYLIDSPGHAIGHMCGLARTSANPPEFILLGGDICHHGSEFRPTEFIPLPKEIEPNPLVAPYAKASFICPGSIFEALHPNKSSTKPFVKAVGFIHDDPKGACESVDKMLEFDAQDNILSVIAHDLTLLDIVDFFPKTMNDWKKKGWKEQGHWRFLRNFDTGKPEYKPT